MGGDDADRAPAKYVASHADDGEIRGLDARFADTARLHVQEPDRVASLTARQASARLDRNSVAVVEPDATAPKT